MGGIGPWRVGVCTPVPEWQSAARTRPCGGVVGGYSGEGSLGMSMVVQWILGTSQPISKLGSTCEESPWPPLLLQAERLRSHAN